MLNTLLAMAFTFLVAHVSVLISTIVLMIFPGCIIFRIPYIKRAGAQILQLLGYGLSDVAGIYAGIGILSLGGNRDLYMVLFIPVIFGCITYVRTRFTFKTKSARRLNELQKGMHVLGTGMACVLVTVIEIG